MSDASNLDSDELLALANWNLQNGDYQGSLIKLKILLSRNNVPLQAYSALGRVYATLGLYERAKGAFGFFIDQQPEGNKSLAFNEQFQLGLVENDLGNVEGAISIWNEILEDNPKFIPAMYHKANALVGLNQIQEAADILNNILENAEDGNEYISLSDQLLSKIVLQ